METLGQRIRRLREGRQFSQQQLADLVGVNLRTVGNWESDKAPPRNRMGALEEVFGVSLTELNDLAPDAIVVAIERSALSRADKAEMLATYYRILDREDRREDRGSQPA